MRGIKLSEVRSTPPKCDLANYTLSNSLEKCRNFNLVENKNLEVHLLVE